MWWIWRARCAGCSTLRLDSPSQCVGVGSVGTRCFVLLMQGLNPDDLLVLQGKEAHKSVIEEVLPPNPLLSHSGERVVRGQRQLQATSDVFLGFSQGLAADRTFYWRQLKDMKGGVVIEDLSEEGLVSYARICGLCMARAHAKVCTVHPNPVLLTFFLFVVERFQWPRRCRLPARKRSV